MTELERIKAEFEAWLNSKTAPTATRWHPLRQAGLQPKGTPSERCERSARRCSLRSTDGPHLPLARMPS